MIPRHARAAPPGVAKFLLLLAAAGAAALLAGCGAQSGPAPAHLPPLPIDRDQVTVSGMSSGGFMAVQFHVAYSSLVHGAGVVAAGPYDCAEDSMRLALGRCMRGDEEIPTDRLVGLTSALALEDSIDPIANLADDRVWIFHGAGDEIVRKPVVDALEQYYSLLVDPTHIKRIEHPRAGHTFPTRSQDAAACDATVSPFVGNCGLDGARDLLAHLYGELRNDPAARGELREFDQRPYAELSGSESLADRGWLYVPATCRERASRQHCRLHVVFHGCRQGASYVGDAFVRRSGYLPVAAANRIVLLFPQVQPSYQPLNPSGCWDFWGYEGDWYALKGGPQMIAVRRMIGDLLGEAADSAD